MNYYAKRRVNHYINVDGIEVEIDYEPYGDPEVERVGNKLVIAYLVQDSCDFNPIENGDCNGRLITRGYNQLITDDRYLLMSHLGLNCYGDVITDKPFPCTPYIDSNGIRQTQTSLYEIAAQRLFEQFHTDDDMRAVWLEYLGVELVDGQDYEIDLVEVRRDMEDINGCFSEEVETLATTLYPDYWRAIAGPFVVPMNYMNERGGVRCYLGHWDGDPDRPPNAIWVADDGAEKNLKGRDQDAINEYAKAICTEYAEWASGDVFGCVAHTYTFEPSNTPCDSIEYAINECEGEWGYGW